MEIMGGGKSINSNNDKTIILGDTIQFYSVYESIHLNNNWLPKIKIFKYFKKNVTKELIDKLSKTNYVNPSYYQLKDKRFAPVNDDLYHLSTGGYGIVFKMEKYVIKFVFENNIKNDLSEFTSEFTVPRFLYNNLKGDEKKFIVCAIAMGINFKISFLKTIYHNVVSLLSVLYNITEEEPIEGKYSYKKALKYFNKHKQSSHFTKIITKYYPFVVNSNINVINNFNYLINFFENERRSNYFFNRGNIIIFPLAKCSAEKITFENCSQYGFNTIIDYLKFMFLQISLLYIKIYELPCVNFIHLDLKPDNVLIFDSPEKIVITVNNLTYVFKEPIRCTLNDFDFSQISKSIPNKKINNTVSVEQNWYYDFHFFSHIIIKIYPEVESDPDFFSVLNEFIGSCDKSICEKSRLHVKKVYSISLLVSAVSKSVFSKWINNDEPTSY